MYIAIDDTYGPVTKTKSKYVTGNRRSHVAVLFQDDEVDYIRGQIRNCLREITKLFAIEPKEFHFVDIYNKNPPWDKLPEDSNLSIFDFFADIYSRYKWRVIIQTVDDHTLSDHGKKLSEKCAGFDLAKKSDLSLFMLLIKIKWELMNSPEPLTILIDEGKRKAGTYFGKELFHNYQDSCSIKFASSKEEGLVQIADFLAYVINRSTHLAMKENRSDTDIWFMQLLNRMKINSEEITMTEVPSDFSIEDFDELHRKDRSLKGIKSP